LTREEQIKFIKFWNYLEHIPDILEQWHRESLGDKVCVISTNDVATFILHVPSEVSNTFVDVMWRRNVLYRAV